MNPATTRSAPRPQNPVISTKDPALAIALAFAFAFAFAFPFAFAFAKN
jgi:hypothetical protein